MAAEARGADLPLFVHWVAFLEWLLPAAEKFPRSARHAFTSRVEGAALDVLEAILEARYSKAKAEPLRRANLRLDLLRVLLRLAHGRRFLPTAGYEHAARAIDEAGRMIGGWAKSAAGKGASP